MRFAEGSQPTEATNDLQEDGVSRPPEIMAGKQPARRLFCSGWLHSAGLQPGISTARCRKQQFL